MVMRPRREQAEEARSVEGWRDCDISTLCTLQRGFDLTEATRKPGTVPVYSSSGVSYFHNEAKLQPPAVITGRKGLLGKVFLVEEPCWPHDTTLWVRDFKGNDPGFVAIFLSQFRLERFDAATSVPTLNRNNLVGHPIQLPSPSEQRVIAKALSDADALLGGLDRLIAKKRDLKHAAMQQLLTGQTRLPGFHGGWAVKRLGALAEIVSGGTPKTTEPAYWNGGIKWCTPTDITGCMGKYLTDTDRTISRLGLQSSGARLLPAGALLLCSRATIGAVKLAGGEICTNQGFKSLVCTPSVSNDFLYYKLLTMKQKMMERAFGSTFLEISKGNVAALEVNTPPPPEQTAIAVVLSDMDAELAALEQRREKTRDLKQAMMQELLTGHTRLLSGGATHA
jgi:type I restriction enzyme S subunit